MGGVSVGVGVGVGVGAAQADGLPGSKRESAAADLFFNLFRPHALVLSNDVISSPNYADKLPRLSAAAYHPRRARVFAPPFPLRR